MCCFNQHDHLACLERGLIIIILKLSRMHSIQYNLFKLYDYNQNREPKQTSLSPNQVGAIGQLFFLLNLEVLRVNGR